MFLKKEYVFCSKPNLLCVLTGIFLLTFSPVLLWADCGNINSSFVTSQTLICGASPNTINFLNTSTGTGAAGATYSWYLNGSLFSTTNGLSTPATSTISALGTYTYMLVAFDAGTGCRDTATVNVMINPVPSASFTVTSNNLCAGTTLLFTNTSVGTGSYTTYAWNFGDGTTAVSTSPTHAYNNGGTYNVGLTVSNGTGCTNTVNTNVTALVRPTINISGDDGDGDTRFCLPPADNTSTDLVVFSNTSSGAIGYSWDFGDGSAIYNTTSTADINHTYTAYGTYLAIMTATGGNGCANSDTITVVFNRYVAAKIDLPYAQWSGCVPHKVVVKNLSQNADAYTWSFGDGSPSVNMATPDSITYTYTTGGSYYINLNAYNGCNSSIAQIGPIVLVASPNMNFTVTPASGCSPLNVSFNNTTTGASPINNFTWNFGNGIVLSGVKNPPNQTYYHGVWTVMLESGNSCGKDTLYKTIIVDTIPHAILTCNPTEGCTPLTVSSTSTSTGGGLNNQWYVDGTLVSSAATLPNQIFTTPAGNAITTHSIRLRTSNTCGNDDTTITITVHPLVNATLLPNDTTICAGNSIAFNGSTTGDQLSYNWNFGNGNTSTVLNPGAQTYNTAGTYTVSYIASGYCPPDTALATVHVTPLPVAPAAKDTTICSGTSTTLTATASGGTYEWYNAATGGTLLYTGSAYTTPVLTAATTYYVQTKIGNCASPRTAVVVSILPSPVAPTASGTVICAGDSSTLIATAPGGSYQWYNAANGGTLLASGASFTTPPLIISTTYYVQTTVAGCTGSRTPVSVTVNPIPAAPTVQAAMVCAGNNAAINVSAPGGTYNWYDAATGGTLLFTGSPYITPVLNASATYYVQSTLNGCTGPRALATVIVNPIPVADINADTSSGCSGLIVHFDNNSTLGGTYTWTFNGATPGSSSAYTPTAVTFTTSGNNMVSLLVNVAGCVMSDTIYISIAPRPVPAFALSSVSGCTPLTSLINNTSTVTAGDVYLWNLGNGNTSTLQNPATQTYTTVISDTTYSIKLLITALNGCKDSVTHTLVVHPLPAAQFTAADDSICAGTNLLFTNGSLGSTTYSWDFGDGATGSAANPTHNFTQPGTYIVELIAASAYGCADTVQQSIVADSIPTASFTSTTACFGNTTPFTSTSSGSVITWTWNFGDGSIGSTLANPSHLFPSFGTYNVSLQVTNIYGCTHSVIQALTVNPTPVAAFSNSIVCEGVNTIFTDQSTNNPQAWSWDFGDGSALSAQQNPTHTYLAGTYTATLIASGIGNCADTLSKTIIVNPVPIAGFTFANVCKNDTMFFASTASGAPNSYTWTFGDGFSNNTGLTNVTHPYSVAGNYTVSLIAGYSATGCADTISQVVTVYPRTTPLFTTNSPCLHNSVIFVENSGGSPMQWQWDFGDGSPFSSSQNPAHSYGNSGTYTVTLTTQNNFGCTDSLKVNVTVNPLPIAIFKSDTVCLNTATSFTDMSTAAAAWNWDYGDGSPTGITSSPTHIYPAAGTYTVLLQVTNSFGCTDTVSHAVIVRPNPAANFSANATCLGYSTQFSDSSLGVTSWLWNFGDGSPSDITAQPSHTYPAAGIYNATLIVTNVFSCRDTIVKPVLINSVPVANFNSTNACVGNATNFTNQSTGSPAGWIWDFGDGSVPVTNQHPAHTYSIAGTYTVTLIALGSSGGCNDTLTLPVVVNPIPVADFSYANACKNDSVSFVSLSTGSPDTFNWVFGDGFSDGTNDSSPRHIYSVAGTYQISLVAGYSATGCSDSITKTITIFPRTQPGFTSTSPCQHVITQFTDTSNGSPIHWVWNFGDGSLPDTLQNPSHLYSKDSTYYVTLITTNAFGCIDSIKLSTTVNPLPYALFTVDTICYKEVTTFTDHSLGAASWNWDFGDGTTLSGPNSPDYTYAAAGNYTAQLVIRNVFGCNDTAYSPVVVNPHPFVIFSASTACHTYPTFFGDSSVTAVSWLWDFGDLSPLDTTADPAHTYTNPGTFPVSLTVINSFGCVHDTMLPVTVLPQPQANFSYNTVCAGHTVQFSNISNDTSITNYYWDFGDGSNSAISDPGHIYTQGGNNNVSFIVTNNAGCSDTLLKTVTVHHLPIPLFTATSTCEGTATSFTDLSTDTSGIASWFYDFNDGNNSLSQNPNYIYAAAGIYNVSLTVTNNEGCDSTIILPVTVNLKPQAKYTVDTVCMGTATTFTDISSGSPGIWRWDFGDGNFGNTGPVTTHTYAIAGSYLTSLTVMSTDSACTSQAFKIVVVRSDVIAGIASLNKTCVYTALNFNDSSIINSGTILYSSWDFGDGSALVNTLNATHTYGSAGTYVVTHVVSSDGGCTSTKHDTIIIHPQPVANFSALNSCELQSSSFTDNSQGSPAGWNWNFGDGDTSTLQNPQHIYSNAGTYLVSLIVSTGQGCYDTLIKPIQVYEQPVAGFSSNTVCWGDTTLFTNTSTVASGSIASYYWIFSDGTNATVANPSHVFVIQNDTFQVSLVVASNYGCVDTLIKPVYLHPLPVFNFSPQQASGCNEFTTMFLDNSTVAGGAIVNWLWNFDDGNLTYTHNPVHTYDSAGSYYVSLQITTTYGCVMKDTLNYPIIVYPHPDAGFIPSSTLSSIYEPGIHFYDASSGATMWDWNLDDNSTSIVQSPYHVYKDTGTFHITQIVMNQYGCSDTLTQQVRIYGETTLFIPNAFSPDNNGLNDVFNPKSEGILEFEMLIFDRWGKQLFKTNDMNEGWNGKMNGNGELLQGDVYVYKITTKDILKNNHSYVGNFTLVR